MVKNRTLLAAAFVALALGAAPAFAAEGNDDPFARAPTGLPTTAVQLRPVAADVGSEQEYDPSGRPGTSLQLSAEVLLTNGSEGAVQTANSMPLRFEEGSVQFAHTQDAQARQAAQPGRATSAVGRHHAAGSRG